MKLLLSVITFLIPLTLFPGFGAGTPVLGLSMLRCIEKLTPGTSVAAEHNNKLEFKPIIALWKTEPQRCYELVLPNEEKVIASHDQKLCLVDGTWQVAEHLSPGDHLLNREGQSIVILEIRPLAEPLECYDITVAHFHTFFVSKHQILAHNIIPIAITISFLIGGGVEFAGVSVGCAALGTWMGIQLWKSKNTNIPIEGKITGGCGMGMPDPEDPWGNGNKGGNQKGPDNEERYKRHTGPITNKMARDAAARLGFVETNYYSDKQIVFQKGNLYITADNSRHSGGFWKMATSVKELADKTTRLGTYDELLNRIGN